MRSKGNDAMRPFGRALLAFSRGDTAAEIELRRDDGLEVALPASFFFRSPEEFSAIENLALTCCRGRVLDIGAGTGLHALWLEEHGLEVTALDVDPETVEVMVNRGVPNPVEADVFTFEGGPFDTLLLLGHGIGMVEDLEGLDRFLTLARDLTSDGGQVLVHSTDVRKTDDPVHLAYHERNRRERVYVGEIRLQVAFEGIAGTSYRWLHADPATLRERSEAAGWQFEMLTEEESGEYLARLVKESAASSAVSSASEPAAHEP